MTYDFSPDMEGGCNVLNKQSGTADKGLSPNSGIGEELLTPHFKNILRKY
jgi:hypothetical protein